MRQFRAWDKRNNKWFHPDLLIITNAGFYEDHREFEDGNSLFDYEYELNQFTGLYDSKKNPIYEGDIVNVNFFGGTPKYEKVYFYTVGGSIGFHPFTNDGRHWSAKLCGIVGNIYENPELIGK